MADQKDFRRWCRFLRRKFPPCYPVRISLVAPSAMRGLHGECTSLERDGKLVGFRVRVADGPQAVVQDSLFHEYAHVLRMHLYGFGKLDDHDPVYGAIHGMLISAWHDEVSDG